MASAPRFVTCLIADAHAVAPPAVAAAIRVSIRVTEGRPGPADRMAVAVRSTREAGSTAVSDERDVGARFVSRREGHRLRGRRGREAENSKGRRNQDFSHKFAFRFAARRALKRLRWMLAE